MLPNDVDFNSIYNKEHMHNLSFKKWKISDGNAQQ
jgi:hypothetical protein